MISLYADVQLKQNWYVDKVRIGSRSTPKAQEDSLMLLWIVFRIGMAREVRGKEGIGIGIVEKECSSVLSERLVLRLQEVPYV